MTPVQLALATLAAALAAVLIHCLSKRVRKRIVVATLRPFDGAARPRWQWLAPEQRWLLLARLIVLALALWLLVRPAIVQAPQTLNGATLAVTPGAAPDSMDRENFANALWLDALLSPLAATPRESAAAAGALLRLDQLLRDDAALTLAGPLPAAHWPQRMPLWRRDFDRRVSDPSAASSETITPPAAIVIDVTDAGDAALWRDAVALWRRAGLLPASTPIREDVPATAGDWLISDDAKRRAAARENGTVVVDVDDVLHPSESLEAGVIATRAWQAVGLAMAAPLPAAARVPSLPPAAAEAPPLRLPDQAGEARLPPAWLALMLLALLAERLLSLRRGGR